MEKFTSAHRNSQSLGKFWMKMVYQTENVSDLKLNVPPFSND